MPGKTKVETLYNSAWEVELEKDLSLKQQFPDVVVIRKKDGKIPDVLPDGLENLVSHNLITYKSHQESLNGRTVEELIGHYINYSKQVSRSTDDLMPEENVRLYAVSTRYPEKLSGQTEFREVCEGVYDVRWVIRDIRFIVLSRIAPTEKNAPLLMFSADPDKVGFGAQNYKWQTPVSSVMNRIFEKYRIEGVTMPYTMDDYLRETKEETVRNLTPDDIDRILKSLKPEEVFKRFRPEDRLRGISPEEIEKYLRKMRQKKSS